MVDVNTTKQSQFIGTRPARAFIVCNDLPFPDDLNQIPRTMEVFFNPMSVNINGEAVWTDISVPGLSHQVHQYSHSKSDRITFTLLWDRILASRRANNTGVRQNINSGLVSSDPYIQAVQSYPVFDPYKYKEFLRGLTVPQEPGYAPSTVTFIWPRFLHIVGIVKKVSFVFNRFARTGVAMGFRANVAMSEFRTVFRKRIGADQFFWDTLSNVSQAEADATKNVETSADYEFTLEEAEGVDFSFTEDEVYGS